MSLPLNHSREFMAICLHQLAVSTFLILPRRTLDQAIADRAAERARWQKAKVFKQ